MNFFNKLHLNCGSRKADDNDSHLPIITIFSFFIADAIVFQFYLL
jgi:hypothetical protein